MDHSFLLIRDHYSHKECFENQKLPTELYINMDYVIRICVPNNHDSNEKSRLKLWSKAGSILRETNIGLLRHLNHARGATCFSNKVAALINKNAKLNLEANQKQRNDHGNGSPDGRPKIIQVRVIPRKTRKQICLAKQQVQGHAVQSQIVIS
jgi:hypothetical protein